MYVLARRAHVTTTIPVMHYHTCNDWQVVHAPVGCW